MFREILLGNKVISILICTIHFSSPSSKFEHTMCSLKTQSTFSLPETQIWKMNSQSPWLRARKRNSVLDYWKKVDKKFLRIWGNVEDQSAKNELNILKETHQRKWKQMTWHYLEGTQSSDGQWFLQGQTQTWVTDFSLAPWTQTILWLQPFQLWREILSVLLGSNSELTFLNSQTFRNPYLNWKIGKNTIIS